MSKEDHTSAILRNGLLHTSNYFEEFMQSVKKIDLDVISSAVNEFRNLRKRSGRLFILGVGGSAGNASHAVNDFRKICGIEAYAPTDNVSEFSAWINDADPDLVFRNWLEESRLSKLDICLFFSVGGGNIEKKISRNLVEAAKYANELGAVVISIVGKKDGFLQQNSKICLRTDLSENHITPHAESLQPLIWHAIVFNPLLKNREGKWESYLSTDEPLTN